MVLSMSGVSTLENVMQLVGLVAVFIIILVAAYFTARFVGTSGAGLSRNRNIKVIETYKLGSNKFLQLIEVSGKYIVVSIGKDTIGFITELDESQVIKAEGEIEPPSFKQILNNIKNKNDKLNKKK